MNHLSVNLSVENIMQDIQKLNVFVEEVEESVRHITKNIENVKNISGENGCSIAGIVKKNEETAAVAVELQKQSEPSFLQCAENPCRITIDI